MKPFTNPYLLQFVAEGSYFLSRWLSFAQILKLSSLRIVGRSQKADLARVDFAGKLGIEDSEQQFRLFIEIAKNDIVRNISVLEKIKSPGRILILYFAG